MDGAEVVLETKILGDNNWMARYQEVCRDYSLRMMTNDNLEIKTKTTYK